MKKLIFAALAITVLVGNAAVAADLPAKAPPLMRAPVAASWTGCYIGAGWSYTMANLDHSVTNAAGTAVFDTGHDNSAKGWGGTVSVGCDYQLAQSWVIGAFGDWDWTGVKGRYSFNCPGGCLGPTGYIGDIKDKWAWYAGGRIGYVVVPQLLAYVSGGWTEARFGGVNYFDAATRAATGLTRPEETRGGWFIGAGDEYALGFFPGLFWKTEYRYAKYEGKSVSQTCTVTGACGAAGTVHSTDNMRPTVQTIRTELVWRFNMGGSGPGPY
jgi:outer membrane immunogenic protein